MSWLASERQAAKTIGVPPSTLRAWRTAGLVLPRLLRRDEYPNEERAERGVFYGPAELLAAGAVRVFSARVPRDALASVYVAVHRNAGPWFDPDRLYALSGLVIGVSRGKADFYLLGETPAGAVCYPVEAIAKPIAARIIAERERQRLAESRRRRHYR